MSYGFKIVVEGDYALFTRPEMKVERVSYDVPTVSALEGLVKCIYWKPAIRIVIDKIVVFHPIRFLNVRRNELKSKVLLSAVKAQMKGTGSAELFADDERSQRASMLRRLQNGQHFRQPCLGCREFSVNQISLVEEFDYTQVSETLKGDIDLGFMLYGMRFQDGGKPLNGDWVNPKFSDEADAVYYRPHMIDGVIDVGKYREATLC